MSKYRIPYLGEKGVSSFLLHKSQISNWTTCKRSGYNSIMDVPQAIESGLITNAGTSFHAACNRFFDRVDPEGLKDSLTALTDQSENIIQYFKDVLDGSPENREFLEKFAKFQYDRLINLTEGWPDVRPSLDRWFPCNRELEIVRQSRGLWGTIDSVEYIGMVGEDRACVEYKSGKLTEWRMTKLRRELAVYKLLLDDTPMAPIPIRHIGAFCAGNDNYSDGIMFERLNTRTITALFKVIKEIRTTFEKAWIAPGEYDLDYFPIKSNPFCLLCNYSSICFGE